MERVDGADHGYAAGGAPGAAADGAFALQVRVKRLEFLGADWLIYGVLEGTPQEEKILSKVPPRVAGTLREGELREFRVEPARLRYFDPATGLRVDDGPR